MAIFQGGFSREAAQEVAGANLRILMSLVHKSLIHRSAETGRYTIHELLRQYALEKLQQNNLEIDTRISHSRYFVMFAADITYQFATTFDANFIPIDKEYDNIISAWHNAIQRQDLELLEQGLSLYLY